MKFFKNLMPICALFTAFLLCSCTAEKKNTDGENSISTPNNNTESSVETTPKFPVSETTLNEEALSQIKAEKESQYLRSLDDLELDTEKIKETDGKALSSTDFTDCFVAVLSPYGEKILEYLSAEDTKSFIECITKAEISTEEYEVPQKTCGEHLRYQITLKTGEQIFIGTSNDDLLVINMEHGYLCDKESSDRIRNFYNESIKRFEEKAMNQ